MSWITVCGQPAEALEKTVHDAIQQKLASGEIPADQVKYIQQVRLHSFTDLAVSALTLERLRRLAQTWEVRLIPQEITSHRAILGPIIVAAKRAMFPVLQYFFKTFIQQQRSFNAGVVELLTELSHEVSRTASAQQPEKPVQK